MSPSRGTVPALLVVNPAAGSGPTFLRSAGRVDRDCIVEALAGVYSLEIVTTQYAGHATELAEAAASEGLPVVFALGGDGTAREVAAGLVHRETALGLLPGGTTNVLSLALGLPLDALRCAQLYARESMCDTVLARRTGAIDVGRCAERVFLMMVSRGFDAEVLHNLPFQRKRLYGRAGIVGQGLRELLRPPPAPFGYHLQPLPSEEPSPPQAAEQSAHYEAGFLALCNVAPYGGPFRLARGADPTDGELDLVALTRSSRRSVLGLALRTFLSGPLPRMTLPLPRTIQHRRVHQVTWTGEGVARVQIDGDAAEVTLPVRCRVEPGALRVLRPQLDDLQRPAGSTRL